MIIEYLIILCFFGYSYYEMNNFPYIHIEEFND